MKLPRLPHEPAALVDFYQDSMENLGALCERTWFDKLQLVAEGRAARLWNDDGTLHETELSFPSPDTTGPRDAIREIFPGCPLTFRLAEALRPQPMPIERAIIANEASSLAPEPSVTEKLWHLQFSGSSRWGLASPFKSGYHFSLLGLVRCEIQAIDQHWSLHRLAVSWPSGAADPALAAALDFASLSTEAPSPVEWPHVSSSRFRDLFLRALEIDLDEELGPIRGRQQNHLARELERVDDYFAKYEEELRGRAGRSHNENTKIKADQRLAAARAEHSSRRQDQIQRHEIRVIAHMDALLLLAEIAWTADVTVTQHNAHRTQPALFVPRLRKWFV